VTMPSYVPANYDQWVETAAGQTGLPVNVVAAQIEEESGFNPGVTSSAGAEGIAQFLPSTYAAYGGTGSEYSAQNELQPYINLTNADLKWSGGNVQKALAAYNAGQGNWQAGIGYANTILNNAGVSSREQVTPNDVNSSGSSPSANTAPSFEWYNPSTWGPSIGDMLERIGLVIFGGILIIVGIWMLAGKQTIKVALAGAKDAAKVAK
jgi:hypothetical protein